MKNKLLKEIFIDLFSDEMAKYLNDNMDALDKWQITDAIKGALVSLEKKRDWFYQLAEWENLELELQQAEDEYEKERILEQSFQYNAEKIEKALMELYMLGKDDSFLVVNETEIDPYSEHGEKIVGTVPFISYQKFQDYLQEYLEYEDDLDCKWYLIEKYKKDGEEDLKLLYMYIFYKGNVVYYWNETEDYPCWGDPDLNLPVIGYPGELYATDGRPFNKPQRFMMLEKGDNWDCCAVQALVVDKGMVRTGALKHGDQYHGHWSRVGLSPLYSLESFKGELPEEENALYLAKSIMNGCEAAGRRLGYISDVPVGKYTKETLEKWMSGTVELKNLDLE